MPDDIRVLHVDDDADFLSLTAASLGRKNNRITVESASSTDQALKKLSALPIDCLVSDYEMPGMDGIELLEAVRERYPELPFILFTGKGSEEIASEAITAGVSDYLQKGSGSERYSLLSNRIETHVQNQRTQLELRDREKRLDLFIEQSPLGVIRWDVNFELARMNHRATEILGYEEAELEGRSWKAIVPDSDRDAVQDVVADLLENKGGYHSINENIRKDGERFVGEWHNRVVTDADDEVIAIYSQFQDITEQTQREQNLHQLKERYAAYIEQSSDIITVLDEAGTVQYQSPSLERILGYEPSELEGESVADYMHPADRDEVMARFFELVDKPETVVEEITYRFKHADGSWVWLESSGVNKSSSAAGGYVINSRDISERVRREQELQERVKELNAIRRIVELSEAHHGDATALLEAVATDLPQSFQYPDHTEVRVTYGTITESTSAFDRTQQHIEAAEETTGGQVIRLEVGLQEAASERQHDFIDEEQELIQTLVGFLSQYFDRQEHLDDLEHTQERYEQILRHLSDYVTIVDGNGEITYVSPAVEEIANYEPSEVIGTSAFEYIHEADHEKAAMAFSETLENPDREVSVEYRIRRANGSVRWTEARGSNYRNDPLIGGILVAVRDITDRKEREAELERQNHRLERFASVVSHDLRNPLNVADGRLALAAEECDSEHLEDISNALDRMDELIDDLLTLSRQGEPIGETEPIELNALVDACWGNVDTGNATLDGQVDVTLHADRSRLQQLLENLVRNAVEHGGDEVTISVGDLRDGFYVADDGPGIPEKQREDIFEPGYSGAEGGTGFGLAIVHEIVQAHGWAIEVTDGDAGGARFEITGIDVVE